MIYYTKQELFEKAGTTDETIALGGYAHCPSSDLYVWHSERPRHFTELVDILVEDFKRYDKNHTKEDTRELRSRLMGMEMYQLKLLVHGVQDEL